MITVDDSGVDYGLQGYFKSCLWYSSTRREKREEEKSFRQIFHPFQERMRGRKLQLQLQEVLDLRAALHSTSNSGIRHT